MMEWVEGGKTSDRGLDFGVGFLLGEGGGVVGSKRGVAAEENVDDDDYAEREK